MHTTEKSQRTPVHPGHAGEACVGFPPTPNRLIGREETLHRLTDLLDRHRLVTVTGPGGVGKTRLAIEAARRTANAFDDGALYVGLAAVRDGSLVVPTIARVSGLPSAASVTVAIDLANLLAGKSLLLVLDNLEQVSSCAVDIAAVLNACPNLKVLATSRVILNVQAEQVFPVPPLAVPSDMRAGGASSLLDSPSVSLFVERALTHDPQFAVDRENAGNIAAICVRLDGLPLAIELAAARVRMLSLEALLPRLERRLPLLTGGARDAPARQQTLRNTLAWSYNLLSTTEQEIFRRFSVFVGGFTIEAAEAVSGLRLEAEKEGAIPADVFDVISTLADHSLVHKIGTGDDPRFGMLETIREYGLELLNTHGELDAILLSHAEWVAEYVERIRPGIEGPNGQAVLDQYEREHPNIRAALAYALESGNAVLGNRIVAYVGKFWIVHSHARESHRWIEQVLALPGDVNSACRLGALFSAGFAAKDDGAFDIARHLGEEGLALAREVGDKHFESRMLFMLGLFIREQGDIQTAAKFMEDALILARETSASIPYSEHLTAMILANLASIANELGDSDRALEAIKEAKSIWQRRGDRWGLGISTEILATTALARGEIDEAANLYWQAQSLYRGLGDRGAMANCLSGIAIVAAKVGRMSAAVRILAASDAARQSIGKTNSLGNQQDQMLTIARGRAELGERRFQAAWQSGQALTLEDAISEATTLFLVQPSKNETPFGLTPRQLEILRLMADGRTDREIAGELFISYRTVTTHVENILKQMGVDSRTAASTDAVRQGLI